MHLRCAAGEIHAPGLETVHGGDALPDHGIRHLGVPLIRPGPHMAMAAPHVAEAAKIELQHTKRLGPLQALPRSG